MKSTQQEQGGGWITFGDLTSDAASGSGLAQPGNVPYSYVRTATGTYQFYYNIALKTTSVTAVGTAGTAPNAVPSSQGSGVHVLNLTNSAGAATNGSMRWMATARDQRR